MVVASSRAYSLQVCSPWSISHAYIFGNNCGFSFADRKFTDTLDGINAAKYLYPIRLYSVSNKCERWWVTFDKVAVATNKDETSMWFDFLRRTKTSIPAVSHIPSAGDDYCLHLSRCDCTHTTRMGQLPVWSWPPPGADFQALHTHCMLFCHWHSSPDVFRFKERNSFWWHTN